jgi:hypothetical protein
MVRGGIPSPINAILNDIYYEVECLPSENEEESDEFIDKVNEEQIKRGRKLALYELKEILEQLIRDAPASKNRSARL